MYRRRADLEIVTRLNTEAAQQSAQSQRQKHNYATPTDAVSCNSNRDSDFLRCLISFIKSMLVMSNALPFHQVIKILCNVNWNMKTYPQLLMPLGPSGSLGAVAAKPVTEGWDLSTKLQTHFLNVFLMFDVQTQNRSRDCNEAQHGGSTTICTIAETESQSCNTDGCRKL